MYLHRLLAGLYTLFTLAYIIFLVRRSRRISRIEIVILGLAVSKMIVESMTVALYVIWDASGMPSGSLGSCAAMINSLTTTLFHSIRFSFWLVTDGRFCPAMTAFVCGRPRH